VEEEFMRKFLILPALCAVAGTGAWLGSATAAGTGSGVAAASIIVRPGDEVRVPNAAIACRVVRVREFGKRLGFDCRRGGPLAGTYGTVLTAREAALVEFQSSRTAKVVAIGKHSREAERCG
jgi:hypothetical protein